VVEIDKKRQILMLVDDGKVSNDPEHVDRVRPALRVRGQTRSWPVRRPATSPPAADRRLAARTARPAVAAEVLQRRHRRVHGAPSVPAYPASHGLRPPLDLGHELDLVHQQDAAEDQGLGLPANRASGGTTVWRILSEAASAAPCTPRTASGVEHRVDQVVDLVAAAAHHRLSDMDDIGGRGAEDVDAQQLARLGRDEQFEHAVRVADDLPAGQLAGTRAMPTSNAVELSVARPRSSRRS